MKARPILFSPPMVRALLDGRKTQTRRPIKPQSLIGNDGSLDVSGMTPSMVRKVNHDLPEHFGAKYFCPFGKVGDLLWVRETFWNYGAFDSYYGFIRSKRVAYCASDSEPIDGLTLYREWRKTPSIHMPRWASRLTLRITDIRVERVAQIADNDAVSEGLQRGYEGFHVEDGKFFNVRPAFAFRNLWDSINEKLGFGWNANPWVWVLDFEVIHKNVDEVIE